MHKETGRITTLGRGGSDTSAVAIAAAIRADRCDIYTDVDGVYTTDPRVVPRARRLDKIAFEEMLELASLGAKVMQVRSVELGMVHNVRIFVRSSFDRPEDIDPHGNPPGTLICDEEEIMEQQVVTGIAFSKDEAQISIRRGAGQARRRRRDLRPAGRGQHQRRHDRAERLRRRRKPPTSPSPCRRPTTSAPLDVIDQGASRRSATSGSTARPTSPRFRSSASACAAMPASPRRRSGRSANAAINIRAITTSEIKFSLLIDAAFTELAVRTLHSLYGLDKASP